MTSGRTEGPPLRILLAEDNAVSQRVAVRILEQLGCQVDVAEDGARAVSLWEEGGYDLVLMDCEMPVLDGLAATRMIRARERSKEVHRTPVIALTASASPRDRVRCTAVGMDAVLSKPVSAQQLQPALQHAYNTRCAR